jgi:response regulator RpfG family c-di-GMP phosphodiesterase
VGRLGYPDGLSGDEIPIASERRRQFDPRLLDLFFDSIDQLDAVRTAHVDPS